MALLDLLKPIVRTLADWSPDTPRSRLDMDALLADLRKSGVAALDSFLDECLDGERPPITIDFPRASRIARELSEADRLQLLGRAAQISATVTHLDLTWPETLQTNKAQLWDNLLGYAVAAIEDMKPQLDDRTAAALARAARISAPVPATRSARMDPLYVARMLARLTPEPMSEAQRRALADVADLIDGFAWEPHRYANAIRDLEPLCLRLGRTFSESALATRRERAKDTARLAIAYICEGTNPPLKALIEALCQRSPEEVRNSLVAEISALSPLAKGEVLGMMGEAHRRRVTLEAGQVAQFPAYGEYQDFASIGFVSCDGFGPFSDLARQLLKTKIVASDAAAATLLKVMPSAKILADLRVINIAIATMNAEASPQTREAARACLAWAATDFWAFGGKASISAQAARRLTAALDNTGAEQAGEEPSPPRPTFAPDTRKSGVLRGLWSHYGDLSDFRKFSAEDIAYAERCLQGPQPQPAAEGKSSAAQAMAAVINALNPFDDLARWFVGDAEIGALLERMRRMMEIPQELRAPWKALHVRAFELEGKSSPSGKWLQTAHPTLAGLSSQQKLDLLNAVLEMPGSSGVLARAAVYLSASWPAEAVGPILTWHAQNVCFQSNPGVGMRDERLGNACLWALIHLPEGGGVRYLARLLSRVKYPKVKKRIEVALNAAAAKAGITRGELDELSIPTHDLDAHGTTEIAVGDGAALVSISGTASVDVTWRAANGKISKSVPAALKTHKDAIKSVKALVKEIEADLSVQPQRLQRLWLDDRRWPAEIWRQRYAQHPLVGALSRRLIWNVHHGAERVAALWSDGGMSDLSNNPVSLDGAEITLWHPIGCTVDEVMSWRTRLSALDIVQPFKQAHREVYLVTDAERRTGAYSNRFAGHIVKQHQLMALARLNGWMVTHRIWADTPNDQPTHIVLPRQGLVAEFWTEGAGGDDPEVTDSQAYLYLTTDQLRFYRIANPAEAAVASARGPQRGAVVDIADVPPLALSEVMRHCDLFVGVASVANDPNWADGGRDAEHPNQWRRTIGADYWRTQAFGDLNTMAETRLALLAALLPSLALGKVSRIIDGKFLRVEGKLHAYKIHLGSGNILMEPADRYLCIVPTSTGAVDVRLPFEGDNMLSIILSKAAMLANDDKITDTSILSQFERLTRG
ncbi:DUF4132 domain-containing protein [Bradyrhizobium manausense]|uniref:DUF4132 domain-containing protein n=1 Tax=Bradyrhizobium manausense TaxID=989370 RepID=UPI001BA728F1|nr:DUF4132 domain-containing protein [Bradyrhizobium manausense]MBR0835887.1 DUF4132 domain-containing protein [Bradyrhizobium manausense]